MATKTIFLDLTDSKTLRQVKDALHFFNTNRQNPDLDTYRINQKPFTEHQLKTYLVNHGFDSDNLLDQVDRLLSNTQEEVATAAVPKIKEIVSEQPAPVSDQKTSGPTTNIDFRTGIDEIRDKQIKSLELINQKTQIATQLTINALGKKVNPTQRKQAELLIKARILGDQKISPESLAREVIKSNIFNIPTTSQPQQVERIQSTLSANKTFTQKPKDSINIDSKNLIKQAVSIIGAQIRQDGQSQTSSDPTIQSAIDVETEAIVTTINQIAQSVGIESQASITKFSPEQVKKHIAETAKQISSISAPTTKPSLSKTSSSKKLNIAEVTEALPKELIYQMVLNSSAEASSSLDSDIITNNSFSKLIPQNTLSIFNKIKSAETYTINRTSVAFSYSQPDRSMDLVIGELNTAKLRLSSSLRTRTITFVRRRVLGQTQFYSPSNQIIRLTQEISFPVSSPVSSPISTDAPSAAGKILEFLKNPAQEGASIGKKLGGEALGAAKNFLKDKLAKEAISAGLKSLAGTVVGSTGLYIGIAIVVVIGAIFLFSYLNNSNYTFPNVTSIQEVGGGGGENGGIYSCDPETEDCPEPKCVGDLCNWPVQCGCVLSGPYADTHAKNRLNAVDFMTTDYIKGGSVSNCPGMVEGVYVTYPGVVSYVYNEMSVGQQGGPGNYGNSVEIQADEGFTLKYGHLIGIQVELGQRVEVGDLIGTADTNGKGDEHLHFEIRYTSASIRDVLPTEASTIHDGCFGYDDCGGGEPLCIQNLK